MTKTLLFVSLAPIVLCGAAGPVPAGIEFNRDIRPILSDNCFSCHGPDGSHRKAGLRLDLRDEAIAAEAIVPGNASQSGLLDRVFSSDKNDLMPPPESHKTLAAEQKETLKRWIEQGAVYQRHWAYEKPVKAAIPPGENGIDFLVRKRLAKVGLHPAPEANGRTLIRRLHFDLTGLPPKPEEVAAFEACDAPDAYAQLVDRLLKSPHFGERMAIGWLDVVRFADTIGYHSDNPRNVWPYRDWVIQSFNENKPFDRFTIEQVAGDLMPGANRETKIGSAFNRLLLTTEEGGAQAMDYEQRMLTDRVRAIGAAWMGQTTGCAQCHDHKFDPLTMRDFYSMGAFFADIQEPIIGKREDGMIVGTPEDDAKLAQLEAALARAREKLAEVQPALDAAQKAWEAGVLARNEAADKEAKDVLEALKAANPNPKQRDLVKSHFLKSAGLHQAERDAFDQAARERNAFYQALPKCLVSVSDANRRTVRILPRGNWMDESGEIVKASFPGYLPKPEPGDRELTRLDLAQWLVWTENPLTARTVMNRLWKQFFGSGLSKVLDDLGAQGEPAVNPELLDWLACEFMDSGWDMQHMIRVIVASQSYRQASSIADSGSGIADSSARQSAIRNLQSAIQRDPHNREYARQSAYRLDAELVRDNALAISGLLVPKIGGPSVKPYQPERYWENLNFPPREWENDTGEGLHRRGLYTWWQRSFLHPSLLAFDAPSREECAADRNRSNIPQQALVLLNDPTYVEAARAFAARILTECEGTPAQRIAWACRQALQRDPAIGEQETLEALLHRHHADYRLDPAAAEALLRTGAAPVARGLNQPELAAWTHVARVLLNLHETITRA